MKIIHLLKIKQGNISHIRTWLLNTTNSQHTTHRRVVFFYFYIRWRPCGRLPVSEWTQLGKKPPPKTPLLDAISPHLMKLFCFLFLEKRGKIWGTCRRDLHVRQPESRGWNPGSRAEGYYDHVAILHFVVWRRCEWTAQNQTNQLLLTGHNSYTNRGVKDTPVTINGHDGNIVGGNHIFVSRPHFLWSKPTTRLYCLHKLCGLN